MGIRRWLTWVQEVVPATARDRLGGCAPAARWLAVPFAPFLAVPVGFVLMAPLGWLVFFDWPYHLNLVVGAFSAAQGGWFAGKVAVWAPVLVAPRGNRAVGNVVSPVLAWATLWGAREAWSSDSCPWLIIFTSACLGTAVAGMGVHATHGNPPAPEHGRLR